MSWTAHRRLNQLYRTTVCNIAYDVHIAFAAGIRIRIAASAFYARIQTVFALQCFYCSAYYCKCIAHKSSRHRFGRRRGGSHRLTSSSSAAGCLIILVVFPFQHCIALIDWSSTLDSNNIADCRFPRLVRHGMKIWTLINRSCLGLLQTKTMSNINEENSSSQLSMKKNKTNYVVIQRTSALCLLLVLHSIEL
jgi:hypothetical protein